MNTNPAVIVGEAVAGESSKLRTQLESLITTVNKSQFDIGELLSKVKHGGHYQPEFNTFQEYTRSLDIKPRKAQYLVRITDVMSEVGVTRAQYEPVGTAKLREITSLDPAGTWVNPETHEITALKDFIVGFVDKAKELSLDEVKQHVRTLKGFVGENDLVWENFCITRLVKTNIVDPAKELARKNIGSVGKDDEGMSKDASDGACLEAWAVEYLNNPANNVLEEAV